MASNFPQRWIVKARNCIAKNLSNKIKQETSALEQRILRAYLQENILPSKEKSIEVFGPLDLGKVDTIDHTYYILALRILTAQCKIQQQPNQPKHKHFDKYIIRRYGRRIIRPQQLPDYCIYVGNEDSARAAEVAQWRMDNITKEDYEDLQKWLPTYGAHRDDIRQHHSLGACPLQMTYVLHLSGTCTAS